MSNYLNWSEVVENRTYAQNDDGEELGWLDYERVGAHMHWCWYQNGGIRMSPGCLQDVRDKQKELLGEMRRKKDEEETQ